MKLGENILKFRKKLGISQEQLGNIIGVTRQTISNWELEETAPNPMQLKLLSKALNVSVDEFLDNEIKGVLETKISNTEKLAGIIIKILKIMGILFVILLVIDIIAFMLYAVVKDEKEESVESLEITCSLEDNDYLIEVASDGYFNCSNCDKDMQKELKSNYVDYSDLAKSLDNINNYFKIKNGNCE